MMPEKSNIDSTSVKEKKKFVRNDRKLSDFPGIVKKSKKNE